MRHSTSGAARSYKTQASNDTERVVETCGIFRDIIFRCCSSSATGGFPRKGAGADQKPPRSAEFMDGGEDAENDQASFPSAAAAICSGHPRGVYHVRGQPRSPRFSKKCKYLISGWLGGAPAQLEVGSGKESGRDVPHVAMQPFPSVSAPRSHCLNQRRSALG